MQAAHKLGIEVVTLASLIEHQPTASYDHRMQEVCIECECGWIEGVKPADPSWLEHFREVTGG